MLIGKILFNGKRRLSTKLKRKYKVHRQQAVTVYAKHKVLKELARLLEFKDPPNPSNRSINIFVGAHEWLYDYLPITQINIGIQTEQFFDRNGNRLWGMFSDSSLAVLKAKFDLIIDLSFANSKIYAEQDLEFVEFGPYIFPSSSKAFISSPAGSLIFMGAMNQRRKSALEKYQRQYNIQCVSVNTFGDDLDRQIKLSSAVLNIHFEEGIYTEYPRILLSYLNGKPVISEMLDYPMIPDKNYILIGDHFDSAKAKKIFQCFSKEIADNFKLDLILKNPIKKRKQPIAVQIFLFCATSKFKLKKLAGKIGRVLSF